jgi:hypothetical protein
MLGHRRQLVVGLLHALELVFAHLGSLQHDPFGYSAKAAQALGDYHPAAVASPIRVSSWRRTLSSRVVSVG